MQRVEDNRSIGDLLGDLGRQVSTLVRREIDLARVEVTQGARSMGRGAATVAAGGLLAYAGLLALLAAIVLGLVQAGLDPWLAAAIVAVVVLTIGAVLVSIGLKAIRESNIAPTQTAETVKENVEYIKEHVG